MWCTRIALLLIAVFLTACSTTRLVDSDVRSVSSFKAVPVAGYKFERTPLQQAPDQASNQQALESMAEAALAKVGVKRDEARPGYSVQVTARVRREWRLGNADPFNPLTLGAVQIGVGFANVRMRGGFSGGFGMSFPRRDVLFYNREVSLLMRDLSTNQVVYETSAINDGVWADDNNILPILFEAAVSGFPTPPVGVRRVNIDLPPAPPTPPTPSTPPVSKKI
jgi:hypothetical protein